MNRLIWTGLALQLCALPAIGQTTTNAPPPAPPVSGDPVVRTAPEATNIPPQTTSVTAPVPGANSFTEGQARARLERNGFSQVSGLTKGDDGIWRASAMKNGASVHVSVDYQGNVVSN